MRKLIDRIGVNQVLATRLVTGDVLPDRPGEDPVEQAVRYYCDLLDIDRSAFELKVVPDERMGNALGLWVREPARILISQTAASTEAGLLSTAAHELMHEYLLRREILTGQEPDHEQLTDLAMAIFGIGIPHANSALGFKSDQAGIVASWRMEKRGYLSALQMGYAIAIMAHVRADSTEPYLKNLRGDAKHTFAAASRYLAKRDSPIVAIDGGRHVVWPTVQELRSDLEGKDECRQLCALWDLIDNNMTDSQLLEAVVPLLDSPRSELRADAIRALDGRYSEGLRPLLPQLLGDFDPAVRTVACQASAPFLRGSDELSNLVVQQLDERPVRLVNAAAAALAASGTSHRIRLEPILRLLKEAVHRRPEVEQEPLLRLVIQHSANPNEDLRDRFPSENDETLLAELLERLESIRLSADAGDDQNNG